MNDWLTDSELLVMKTVWESKEPLSVQEIMLRTNQKYDKKMESADNLHIPGENSEKRISGYGAEGQSFLLLSAGYGRMSTEKWNWTDRLLSGETGVWTGWLPLSQR